VDVMGLATNAVTVAGLTPYRKGEYFRKEVPVDNSSSAVWQSVNEWGRSLVLTSFIGSANGKEVAHWTRASNKKKAPVTISRLCVSAFNSCPGGVAIYP
jgi:hypothetical protein